MASKSILRMGDQRLLKPALSVTEFNTSELDILIQDMLDSMATAKGIGIAAPQIGIGLRVVIFGFEYNPRYPNEQPVPLTILINPEIEILDATIVEGMEGCLSVPGLRGIVPRCNGIRYRGYNPSGELIERTANGFHARMVQHECDHLDGVLFPFRITDLRKFGYEPEIFTLL